MRGYGLIGTVFIVVNGEQRGRRVLFIETTDAKSWKEKAGEQLALAGWQGATFEFGPIGEPWNKVS